MRERERCIKKKKKKSLFTTMVGLSKRANHPKFADHPAFFFFFLLQLTRFHGYVFFVFTIWIWKDGDKKCKRITRFQGFFFLKKILLARMLFLSVGEGESNSEVHQPSMEGNWSGIPKSFSEYSLWLSSCPKLTLPFCKYTVSSYLPHCWIMFHTYSCIRFTLLIMIRQTNLRGKPRS